MNRARADEIIRFTFYRHIGSLASVLTSNNASLEVAYNVGRYVGMMQKDLETALAKEIEENEHDGE